MTFTSYKHLGVILGDVSPQQVSCKGFANIPYNPPPISRLEKVIPRLLEKWQPKSTFNPPPQFYSHFITKPPSPCGKQTSFVIHDLPPEEGQARAKSGAALSILAVSRGFLVKPHFLLRYVCLLWLAYCTHHNRQRSEHYMHVRGVK